MSKLGDIFSTVRAMWHEFGKCQEYGAKIRPEGIRAQAEDLLHLARLAERSCVLSGRQIRHLGALTEAMTGLRDATDRADFCRMSADRRLELHNNLCRARENLLASLQAQDISEKMQ